MAPAASKLALSGASSFTGVWIACELARAGYSVRSLLSSPESAYEGLKARRLRELRKFSELEFAVDAQGGAMEAWIRAEKPAFWVHHHHFMESFRTRAYDLERARAIGLRSLPGLVAALAEGGCRGFVLTGTAIEPSEMPGKDPLPYAISKQEMWDELEVLCADASIPLAKVVVPNPVGPLENDDRLIPNLIAKARSGETLHAVGAAELRSVSAFELGRCYVRALEALAEGRTNEVIRPQVVVSDVMSWIGLVNRELLEKRLGLPPCPIHWDTTPATPRLDPAVATQFDGAFWDAYAACLREGA